jgi:hypothetical protein
MSLFNFNAGGIPLHSGGISDFKIDCDALTADDLTALAAKVAQRFKWETVCGIPRGGRRFADVLDRYSTPDSTLPLLIVDDVYTTGRSFEEALRSYSVPENRVGVVIFARSEPPDWIHPLFRLWACDIEEQ